MAQVSSCVDDPPGTQCSFEPLPSICRVPTLSPAATLPVSRLAPGHPSRSPSRIPSEQRRAASFHGSCVHGLFRAAAPGRLHRKWDNRHTDAPLPELPPSRRHFSVPPPLLALSVSRLTTRSSQPHITHPRHPASVPCQALQPLERCCIKIPPRRASPFWMGRTTEGRHPPQGRLERSFRPLVLPIPGTQSRHLAPSGSIMLQDVAPLSPPSNSRRIER